MASDQTEATRERAQVQAYLQEHKVNDMLCNMLEAMCIHRPANPQQFVIDWMATQYPDSVNVGAGRAMGTVPAIKAHIDEDDPEAEEDDFETEPPPSDQSAPDMSVQMAMQMNRNKASRRRSAVSAESVDPTSIAKMYERKVHEKDPATRERLATKAQETFLFSTLDKEQLDVLLDAMFQVDHTAGSTIIKQGSEGDNFYIVYSGECDVFVRKGDTESHVLTCLEGDSFGELALLYNWPRAATVKAKTDTTLFAVDRTTFKYIMMDTTIKKRNTYEGFLEHVPLLSSLTKNERQTVADALKSVEYKDGEEIIHQGESGNTFFILEKGEVVCTSMDAGAVQEIGRCKPGDYFGEIALLTNRPRAATVTAVGDVRVLALDRRTFTRVLGPLQDMLKRNMAMYNAYMGNKI